MNGFSLLNCTNIPREVGRSVERSFGVKISRREKNKVSSYGQPCYWFEYWLDKMLPENKDGIEKMKEYVNEQIGTLNPKTTKNVKELARAGINNIPTPHTITQPPLFT
jgi:hypothetical protein